eukprot:5326338-Prymnesium_polylepis.1
MSPRAAGSSSDLPARALLSGADRSPCNHETRHAVRRVNHTRPTKLLCDTPTDLPFGIGEEMSAHAPEAPRGSVSKLVCLSLARTFAVGSSPPIHHGPRRKQRGSRNWRGCDWKISSSDRDGRRRR